MTFLLRSHLDMSGAAQSKLLADIPTPPEPADIMVLMYVIKSTLTGFDGKVLSEKADFFDWFADPKSDVPPEAIWELDGRPFVIRDDRWEPEQKLFLDVVDGQFSMQSRETGAGS